MQIFSLGERAMHAPMVTSLASIESRPETEPGGRSVADLATEPPPAVNPCHVILFLAANPEGMDRLALDREAREIQV
jgi:hypothetical protein